MEEGVRSVCLYHGLGTDMMITLNVSSKGCRRDFLHFNFFFTMVFVAFVMLLLSSLLLFSCYCCY